MKYMGLSILLIGLGSFKFFKNYNKKKNLTLIERFKNFFYIRLENETDDECKKRKSENRKWINNILMKLIFITISSYYLSEKYNEYLNPPIEISFNQFTKDFIMKTNKIEIFDNKFAFLYTNSTNKYNYFIEILSGIHFENKLKNYQIYSKIDIFYRNKKNLLGNIISLGFNFLYLFIIYFSVINIGKIMNQDENKKVIQLDTNVNVKLKDVAGMEETKRDILEFIDFFKQRDKYIKAGTRMPRGALFYGPPGTGKTLMAKAVAGECNIPFISVSGSDFSEIFVGVGSSRVRDLFKKAREKAPCIVFIDEIDALAKTRGNRFGGGGDDKENTLNRLLVELDGFNENDNIMVFGATNRKDTLDNALLRPGRFDRKIEFYLPEKNDRKEILRYYLENLKVDGDLNEILENISNKTYGFSPAELSNICNEASIISIRKKKEKINLEIINEAIEYTIIGPERRNRNLSDNEKNIISHHESGHAFMSYCLKNTEIPIKVSIVPRGNSALGFSMSNISNKKLMTKKDLIDKMCVLIGGRVAEKVFFDDITNGAYDDIEKLTKMASNYVKKFGMDEDLGNLNYDFNNETGFNIKEYSDKTNEKIDKSIKNLVDKVYSRTLLLITQHKDIVSKIAKKLLDKEMLETSDLKEVIGENLLNKY